MLQVTQLIGFGAGAEAARIAHVSTPTGSDADASSYTFSSANLGSSVDRHVAVVFGAASSGTNPAVSSATIAGVSASVVVEKSAANQVCVHVIIAKIPAGTISGDIVVNFDMTMLRCHPVVYELIGAGSATAHDTDTGAHADPINMSLDVPANGCVLAVAAQAGSGATTASWTGVIEDVDAVMEASRTYTSGHDNLVAGESGRTVSVNWSALPSNSNAACASWAP